MQIIIPICSQENSIMMFPMFQCNSMQFARMANISYVSSLFPGPGLQQAVTPCYLLYSYHKAHSAHKASSDTMES